MTYGGFLLRHPLFWAFVSGFACGIALAAATSRPGRSARPARASSRKWTITWLALSVAFAAAAAGMIVVPDLGILRVGSLWVFVAGLVISGLSLRFPRSAGLPVLVIAGTGAIFGGWMVQDYVPVRGRTELGEFTVLSIREQEVAVEAVVKTPTSAEVSEIVAVSGDRLHAELAQLDLSEAFFFFGALRFVSYEGLSGAIRDSDADDSPRSPLLERALELPWFRLSRVSASSPRVNLLRTYRLIADPSALPQLLVR